MKIRRVKDSWLIEVKQHESESVCQKRKVVETDLGCWAKTSRAELFDIGQRFQVLLSEFISQVLPVNLPSQVPEHMQ